MGFKKMIVALVASVALLAGCGGGELTSTEDAVEHLTNAQSDEEAQEALDYLVENDPDTAAGYGAVVPAPIDVEFNEPIDVTAAMLSAVGGQVREDLGEYEGDPRIVRVSVDVTNTSDAPLNVPEYGTGFDVYEGAAQYPVDFYVGYFDYEEITGVKRMPTVIPPGATVEFAESYVFTEDENWNVTFNWNGEDGTSTSVTESMEPVGGEAEKTEAPEATEETTEPVEPTEEPVEGNAADVVLDEFLAASQVTCDTRESTVEYDGAAVVCESRLDDFLVIVPNDASSVQEMSMWMMNDLYMSTCVGDNYIIGMFTLDGAERVGNIMDCEFP